MKPTITEKFRSLLFIDILPEKRLSDLDRIRPGGIVVRRAHTKSPDQVRKLIDRHQEAAPLPLVVAANFEWGVANDIKGCSSYFPGMMALSAACGDRNLGLVRSQAKAIAEEGRSLGVNMLFGPVVDIQTPFSLSTRVFSHKPARVAAFAEAYIEGTQAGGLCATAKHFPGYFPVDTDMHLDNGSVGTGMAELGRKGLVPFRAAVRAGAGAAMIVHVAYPAITGNGLPASMSPVMVKLLRKKLGFSGITITDNMAMGAIARHFSGEEALLNPLRAGIDMVLVNTEKLTVPLLKKCDRIILNDPQLQENIETAFERLEEFRKKWDVGKRHGMHRELHQKSRNLAETVARRSIQVIRDPYSLLPLGEGDGPDTIVLSPQAKDGFHVALKSNFGLFALSVKDALPEATVTFFDDDPSAREIRILAGRCRGFKRIVVEFHEEPGIHGMAEGKIRLAKALIKRFPKKVILAGMVSPAFLRFLPEPAAAVFSFSAMPCSQRALAGWLTNRT